MFGNTFYNQTTKRYIAIFGTLFNDIKLIREDSNLTRTEYLVPIRYAPTQKFVSVLEGDMKKDSPQLTLPMMSYEIINISYDPDRNIAPAIGAFMSATATEKTIVQKPVPYNIDFQLNIATKHLEDAYRIVEQIFPVFKPTFTVSAKLLDNLNESIDLPITLNSVTWEDGYEGPVEMRRPVVWTLTFTLKGYYYGPTSTKKIIKFVTANLYTDLTANNPSEYVTVQPGSTTGNVATTDINITRPWADISESDNWDFIVQIQSEIDNG